MAEVLRCQPVDALHVPFFKPCPSSSSVVAPPKPRRIDFDERPIWRWPYIPAFDPIEEFTDGALTVYQFLDHLVARSPENEALVDVLFVLMSRSALEEAKLDLPPHLAPFTERPKIATKLLSAAAATFRPELARVKYVAHFYDLFETIGGYIVSRVRLEHSKRERRLSACGHSSPASLKTTPTPSPTINQSNATKAVTSATRLEPLALTPPQETPSNDDLVADDCDGPCESSAPVLQSSVLPAPNFGNTTPATCSDHEQASGNYDASMPLRA